MTVDQITFTGEFLMLNLGTLRRRITTSIWIKGIEIELLLITFTNFNYVLYLITCMP